MRATEMRLNSLITNTVLIVVIALSFGYCLEVPALNGRINDLAGLLSEKTEIELKTLLARYEQESGNQIAVLTIQSLQGENLEEYSIRVADQWKLGKANVDNGVLILVVKKEKRIRIEVGYGLESSITDLTAGRIIREAMTPAFAKNDFDKGFSDGIREICAAIESDSPMLQKSSDQAAPEEQNKFGMIVLNPAKFHRYIPTKNSFIARYSVERGANGLAQTKLAPEFRIPEPETSRIVCYC